MLADGVVGEAVLADVAAVVGVDHGHAGNLAIVVVMLADAVRVGVRHIPGAVAALRIVAADIEQEGVFVLHLPDNAERLLGRGSGRSHCAQVDGIDGQRRRPWAGLTAFDHRVHAPVERNLIHPVIQHIHDARRRVQHGCARAERTRDTAGIGRRAARGASGQWPLPGTG